MAAKTHYREDIGNAELIRNIFARKSTTFEGVTVWAPSDSVAPICDGGSGDEVGYAMVFGPFRARAEATVGFSWIQ
jgi:hypothetical protein